jgi:hypothetical protein
VLRCIAAAFASLGERGGVSLLGTYGVGVGGVEVGADNALFLDLGEEVFGERVGECHCWWLWVCLLVWFGGVCWCLGGSGKVARVGWKAFVSEEKGVDWGKKRWVHVCLEGHWHVNVDTGPKSLSWRAFACL